jgi:hypothetical protein
MALRKMFRRISGGLLFLVLGIYGPAMQAQCAMCRAVLESSDDTSMAEGINNGIVYLMAVPYILVGALIFIVYRKMRAD